MCKFALVYWCLLFSPSLCHSALPIVESETLSNGNAHDFMHNEYSVVFIQWVDVDQQQTNVLRIVDYDNKWSKCGLMNAIASH